MENQQPTQPTQPTKPESNKNAVIVIVVAVVIVAVLLIGYFIYRSVATKVTESGIEKLIEAQTGQKIDIDRDGQSIKITTEDGEEVEYNFNEGEGTVNIKTNDDEGEFKFKADEDGLDVPDTLKNAMPIFEPATMITLNEMEDLGISGTFTTSKSQEDVKNFYLDKMEDKGWSKTGSFEIGDRVSINFEKDFGSEIVTIMIYTVDDKTHFLLNYTEQ